MSEYVIDKKLIEISLIGEQFNLDSSKAWHKWIEIISLNRLTPEDIEAVKEWINIEYKSRGKTKRQIYKAFWAFDKRIQEAKIIIEEFKVIKV